MHSKYVANFSNSSNTFTSLLKYFKIKCYFEMKAGQRISLDGSLCISTTV